MTNNGGCDDQAICTNTPGSFSCACKPGYSGDGLNCTGIIFIYFLIYLFIYLFRFFDVYEIFDYYLFLAMKCPPISIGNANYSITLAGNTALGKCDDLYYGSPTLYCNLIGSWNQTITGNPCSSISFDPSFLFFSFFLVPFFQFFSI